MRDPSDGILFRAHHARVRGPKRPGHTYPHNGAREQYRRFAQLLNGAGSPYHAPHMRRWGNAGATLTEANGAPPRDDVEAFFQLAVADLMNAPPRYHTPERNSL